MSIIYYEARAGSHAYAAVRGYFSERATALEALVAQVAQDWPEHTSVQPKGSAVRVRNPLVEIKDVPAGWAFENYWTGTSSHKEEGIYKIYGGTKRARDLRRVFASLALPPIHNMYRDLYKTDFWEGRGTPGSHVVGDRVFLMFHEKSPKVPIPADCQPVLASTYWLAVEADQKKASESPPAKNALVIYNVSGDETFVYLVKGAPEWVFACDGKVLGARNDEVDEANLHRLSDALADASYEDGWLNNAQDQYARAWGECKLKPGEEIPPNTRVVMSGVV